MTAIKYLSLSKPQRFAVNFVGFFKGIGKGVSKFFRGLPNVFLKLWNRICAPFGVLKDAFTKGTLSTKLNFVIMGFSQLTHRQIARGVLYLVFEIVFLWYFFAIGVPYLGKLGTLGSFSSTSQYLVDPIEGTVSSFTTGDSSFVILLYSIVTFILLIIFICLWYFSIRDAKSLQDNYAVGKLGKNSDFFKELTDKNFHTLLLAIPMVGLVGFTVIPVIFMVITGFTNYNGKTHAELYDWVGFDNFTNLFSGFSSGNGDIVSIFFKVLAWTLLWALIATFTNYFLGMIIALLINKKGIKLKKLWRTVLILTIAVPQFVSLLLINRMLSNTGFLTRVFVDLGWVQAGASAFDSAIFAKVLIVIVNMWVGVPYTMLICSGILMNIPEDLYESARIDGASSFKMYMSITLPYMLFITLPYLISQFVGNINNFNIIYLLSAGGPSFNANIDPSYGDVGQTDLLITWIYKMSMQGDEKNYAVACVLGLLIFLVIAVISLIFYGRSGSVKNEEDFQ